MSELEFTCKDLIEGNIYQYRVAAENKAGIGPFSDPTQPTELKEPTSNLHRIFRIIRPNFVAGKAPSFTEKLRDLTVALPRTPALECCVDYGDPKAEIRWFKVKYLFLLFQSRYLASITPFRNICIEVQFF